MRPGKTAATISVEGIAVPRGESVTSPVITSTEERKKRITPGTPTPDQNANNPGSLCSHGVAAAGRNSTRIVRGRNKAAEASGVDGVELAVVHAGQESRPLGVGEGQHGAAAAVLRVPHQEALLGLHDFDAVGPAVGGGGLVPRVDAHQSNSLILRSIISLLSRSDSAAASRRSISRRAWRSSMGSSVNGVPH